MTHDEHEHAHKDEQKFELDFNVAYNPSWCSVPRTTARTRRPIIG